MDWVGEGTQVGLVVVVEEGTLVVVAAAAMLVVIDFDGMTVVAAAVLLGGCEVVVSGIDAVVDIAAVVLEADAVPVGVTTEGEGDMLTGTTSEVLLIGLLADALALTETDATTDALVDIAAPVLEADGVPMGVTTEDDVIGTLIGTTREARLIKLLADVPALRETDPTAGVLVDEAAVVLEADGVPVSVTTEDDEIGMLTGMTSEVWLIEMLADALALRETDPTLSVMLTGSFPITVAGVGVANRVAGLLVLDVEELDALVDESVTWLDVDEGLPCVEDDAEQVLREPDTVRVTV